MTAQLERELASRLDFSAASHCGPGDASLSSYEGRSTAWVACDHARRFGPAFGELSREGLLCAHQTRAEARASGPFAQHKRAECAEAAARTPPRPKNSWKLGSHRSPAAKAKQSAAMLSYYHQRGLSDKPGAAYMRAWRAKAKAERGQA